MPNPEKQNALRAAALSYAARGWAVFPLFPKTKMPAVKWGTQATNDETQVTAWWEAHPKNSIAIATGVRSGGLLVIDLDVKPEKGVDGTDVLRDWEIEHGDLPETVQAESGSGGVHLYFHTAKVISSTANEELGVDIRAKGGMVVAPPSIHKSGNCYVWENSPDEYEVAEADENTLAFIDYVQEGVKSEHEGGGFELPEKIKKGSRDDKLFRYGCKLQSGGLDDSLILATLLTVNQKQCVPPMKEDEVVKIAKSLTERYEKGGNFYDLEYTIAEKIRERLVAGGGGKPAPLKQNCITVLQLDPNLVNHFFYDTRAYTVMCHEPPWDEGSGTRPIKDTDYTGLTAYGERNYRLGGKENWIDALQFVAHQNPRNMVVEWLNSLTWDGKPRMGAMFQTFLGAADTPYTTAVSRLMMLGAVARAYHPGCKFDYVPVLEGKQGLGKSVFVQKLAMRPDWTNDNFNTFSGKEAVEKLRGVWIAEVAELLALKKTKEVEAVKAFITSTCDTLRVPWGRETEQRPRACIFVGTTNDASFLSDSTGNRRWLPVECGVTAPSMDLFAPDAYVHFEQAWAETVHIFLSEKPQLLLPRGIQGTALQIQASYTEDDPRIGLIQRHLDNRIQVARQEQQERAEVRVCAAELVEFALPDEYKRNAATRRGTNELHALMRNKVHGWEPYPNKNHNAVCPKPGAMRDTYGKQRCYIPTKEYWMRAAN